MFERYCAIVGDWLVRLLSGIDTRCSNEDELDSARWRVAELHVALTELHYSLIAPAVQTVSKRSGPKPDRPYVRRIVITQAPRLRFVDEASPQDCDHRGRSNPVRAPEHELRRSEQSADAGGGTAGRGHSLRSQRRAAG